MKIQTAELLKKHLDNGSFEFVPSEKGLEFNYELSDDEVLAIVETEYGSSLTQPVDELFKVIVKKLVNNAIEKAKETYEKDN